MINNHQRPKSPTRVISEFDSDDDDEDGFKAEASELLTTKAVDDNTLRNNFHKLQQGSSQANSHINNNQNSHMSAFIDIGQNQRPKLPSGAPPQIPPTVQSGVQRPHQQPFGINSGQQAFHLGQHHHMNSQFLNGGGKFFVFT